MLIGYHSDQHFVTLGEAKFWIDANVMTLAAKPFCHTDSKGFTFKAEVYWHKFPLIAGVLSCLFWCLPWWATAVFGPGYSASNGNFIGKNADTWRGMIQDFSGLPNAHLHLRPSTKSLLANARIRNASVDATTMLSAEQEFSVSTFGLLMLSGAIANNKRLMAYQEPAGKVIDCVIDKFFGRYNIIFEVFPEISFRVDQGSGWSPILSNSLASSRIVRFFRLVDPYWSPRRGPSFS